MVVRFKTTESIMAELQSALFNRVGPITDINVGSVINQYIYAVSNAIQDLENLLLNIYDAALTIRASGPDLDNKVVDYGLTRKGATAAVGTVTFVKNALTSNDITVPSGATVTTSAQQLGREVSFQTTAEVTMSASISNEDYLFVAGRISYDFKSARRVGVIVEVRGTVSGLGYTFTFGVDYTLDNTSDIAQSKLQWLTTGTLPDDSTNFYIDYKPLSVDADIEAVAPGTDSNVPPYSIIVLDTTVGGIDSIINYLATSGGTDLEDDVALKGRVPLFLSSLSKGTDKAIRAKILSIPAVKNITIEEPDPPAGYINAFIDDGSGGAPRSLLITVKSMVDGGIDPASGVVNTSVKACGTYVNVYAPRIRSIDIEAVIRPTYGADLVNLKTNLEQALKSYFSGLRAGETVLRTSVIYTIRTIKEVLDVPLDDLYIDLVNTGDIEVSKNMVPRLGVVTLRFLDSKV